MAKIRLDVDQLSVESFSVLPDEVSNVGTVKGHGFEDQFLGDSFNNPSCQGTCVTCPGGQTCTCPATCAQTCQRSCPPCVIVVSVDVVCYPSLNVPCVQSVDIPCQASIDICQASVDRVCFVDGGVDAIAG